MAITLADFNKIWASTSPLTPYSFSESNYKQGWNFIGSTPPARQMWDFLQKHNDEKMQYLANNYLPLSGGTMTGEIKVSGYLAGNINNSSDVKIAGGTNVSNGASLTLNGKDTSGVTGRFSITANDGTNVKYLVGRPDGALLWDGNEVVTSKVGNFAISKNVDNGFMQFNGGTLTNKGANLLLFGIDDATRSGYFRLVAKGEQDKTLEGKPDGTLTWNGNSIALAKDYLPLSGGTMTNGIAYSSTDYRIYATTNTQAIGILGGSDFGSGAALRVFGKDYATASDAGSFAFQACDTNGTRKYFIGKPDGTLTWNGQPIQTSSDKRLKQDFSDVPDDVLEAWGKVEWQQFKYKADAERKGDSCRFHTGLVAQDVKEVGEENNVDLLKYGILCHDVREAIEEEKDEDGNVIKEASEAVDLWTVRYEEALAMEVIYLRNEIKKLREEIKALRTE